MDAKEAEFLKRLKATFRIEAEEHVRAMSAGLIELEKQPAAERGAELIETIFREAHSLKGAARSVSLKDIESICQPLESAFSALKRGATSFSPALCDLFHQSVDFIAQLVSSKAETTPAERSRLRELTRQLAHATQSAITEQPEARQQAADRPPAEAVTPPAVQSMPSTQSVPHSDATVPARRTVEERSLLAGTVRVPADRLDALLLQAEEMVSIKMAVGQRVADIQEIRRLQDSWKAESVKWKDRISATDIPQWNEWQTWNETCFNEIDSRMAGLAQALEQDHRTAKRLVDEHLETAKGILMLPVASLLDAFPKVVRDLAHDQGKDAELVVHGAEVEIDKRILDELKDPLIHLMRNCVGHGIGKPEERTRQNKTPRGTITITVTTRDSRQVEVLVADDGAGIDLERVRAAAAKAGILSREETLELDMDKVLALIFQSGVSTSPFITDLSGRGLGLTIVREKVEKLGGIVSAETATHVGTTFRLLLPLTLATFRGVLVRADEQLFVLPTAGVERALRVSPEMVKTVENRDTIQLDGHVLSVVSLGAALGMQTRKRKLSGAAVNTAQPFDAVVLMSGDKRIAFAVDEILEEQQVMVKSLGKQLRRVRNVAGATVLGSGKVVPVLNTSDLMKSAAHSPVLPRVDASAETPSRKGHLLVADDSITARTLIKNILETAGWQVTTAVDGADAFTQARGGDFDLIVSDVDMPRMSGFELTEKVRADKRLGELPVVLVTALESREDRERGSDAGANAYIVKSSFDQSNLLEVIHRLL